MTFEVQGWVCVDGRDRACMIDIDKWQGNIPIEPASLPPLHVYRPATRRSDKQHMKPPLPSRIRETEIETARQRRRDLVELDVRDVAARTGVVAENVRFDRGLEWKGNKSEGTRGSGIPPFASRSRRHRASALGCNCHAWVETKRLFALLEISPPFRTSGRRHEWPIRKLVDTATSAPRRSRPPETVTLPPERCRLLRAGLADGRDLLSASSKRKPAGPIPPCRHRRPDC